MDILKIYLLFWTFSIIGWLMEVVICSIDDKKIVNRGFLIGPYCPIYGFGSLIMLFLTPYKEQPITCFLLALVLCSVLEYFTSYIMEKMFKVRWWDYSNDAFNINGRICLKNAIAFGALGVLFTIYLHPLFMAVINMLSNKVIIIISIIILILTLADIILSFLAMNKIKIIINKKNSLLKKDATSEIKKLIRETLNKMSFLEKRLISTYHLFDKKGIKDKLNKINNKTKSGYGFLLCFILLGIVLGLFISILLKLDIKIVIAFSISLTSLIAIIILKVGNK